MKGEATMLNRCLLALVIVGLTVGYLSIGSPVNAQNSPLPFASGDTVTLRFGSGSLLFGVGEMYVCPVTDIRGTFVRCASKPRAGVAPEPPELWFNLQSVASVVIDR